jgi:hypothetical protein
MCTFVRKVKIGEKPPKTPNRQKPPTAKKPIKLRQKTDKTRQKPHEIFTPKTSSAAFTLVYSTP